MAGKLSFVDEQGACLEPLSVRFIGVTGDYGEIGVTNNLWKPVTINKVLYVSAVGGTEVKGTVENPGIVKPHEEIRFTVSVPSTIESNLVTIHLTFYAETHGLPFTYEVTVYSNDD